MYRPAGIYLINLLPLGNWANTVYFMLKTSISRNEIYIYTYTHLSLEIQAVGMEGQRRREGVHCPYSSSGTKDGNSHAEQGFHQEQSSQT